MRLHSSGEDYLETIPVIKSKESFDKIKRLWSISAADGSADKKASGA